MPLIGIMEYHVWARITYMVTKPYSYTKVWCHETSHTYAFSAMMYNDVGDVGFDNKTKDPKA